VIDKSHKIFACEFHPLQISYRSLIVWIVDWIMSGLAGVKVEMSASYFGAFRVLLIISLCGS
jgi:hypothetical protein